MMACTSASLLAGGFVAVPAVSGLLALFDAYYQRSPDGTWGNELEAFEAITCADERDHLDVERNRLGLDRHRGHEAQGLAHRLDPDRPGPQGPLEPLPGERLEQNPPRVEDQVATVGVATDVPAVDHFAGPVGGNLRGRIKLAHPHTSVRQ